MGKLFNAVNNALDDYKASCADRWNPIKTHITEHEVLPREGIKTTMARSCGNIYKDLTAPTQGT